MCPTPACPIFTRTQDFTQKRMYDKLITETKAFNVTYMYIDDILSETASSVSFCDIFLKFTQMVTFLPESRNYFNFPHLDSNINIRSVVWSLYFTTHTIRATFQFTNAYSNLLQHHRFLSSKLLSQVFLSMVSDFNLQQIFQVVTGVHMIKYGNWILVQS
jgi:hypothetical protein